MARLVAGIVRSRTIDGSGPLARGNEPHLGAETEPVTGGSKMSRCRSKISHIIAIAGLTVLVASATVPCSAWAKGGDQGNSNGGGNGNGNGHDNNGNGGGNGNGNGGGNGNGNGHDNNGNGGGNGNGNGGGSAGGATGGGGAANGGGASGNGGGGAAASGGGASGNTGGTHGGSGAANGGSGIAQANTTNTASPAVATGTSDHLGGIDEALANNSMLGRAVVALNATMAVPRPPAQAGLDLRIQQMAAYDRAMLHALALPDRTPTQRTARNRTIAGARIQLAVATHRRLNPAAITRIDSLLGLPASDPTLGVQ